MLLTAAILLGVLSAFLEVKFFSKVSFVHRSITHGFRVPLFGWHVEAEICDFVFSILLSWVLGKVFQVPGGLTVFLGAMISTGITKLYWPNEKIILSSVASAKQGWEANKGQIAQTLVDTVHFMYGVLRFITIPIRVARWTHHKIAAAKLAMEGAF